MLAAPARRLLALAALLCAAPASVGAAPARGACAHERAEMVMGTIARIATCDADARPESVEAAFAALRAVDESMSLYRKDSELTRVNAHAAERAAPVGEDLFTLLVRARALNVATDGAFDPTVLPLLRWWGAYPELVRLPHGSVTAVGVAHLELDPATRTVRFRRPGMGLDLGGIAKGFALDRARAALAGGQVRRARLDLGGTLAFLGAGPDGGWRVAVRDPDAPTLALGVLVVPPGAAVSTSANYARDFAAEGWRAPSHIYDPRSGRPARGDLAVTVWAPEATTADALSTGLLVLGSDAAPAALERAPGTGALLVDGTGPTRHVTLHGRPPLAWLPARREREPAARRARAENSDEEDSR